MNVEQILTAIGQTPLPNLLVVGGLVFLFLAIVGKVGAKIVVSEQRQKAAAVIGAVLLLLGLGLQFAGQLVPLRVGRQTPRHPLRRYRRRGHQARTCGSVSRGIRKRRVLSRSYR